MSYQVLARKWRPRSFREMVGQEHVLQALINALDHDRLHHAYLFTGTRGVGKTTIARILAKCLNCEQGVSSEPCGQCSSCLEIAEGRSVDLLEVDAASRTKVEDTRELLDNVQYAPTRSRYKVYLIDEVHMLSNHSFNALLKTLEEPPPHVKFLLATTDPQKLPATILSRCLQFNLKNMPPEQIVGHLGHILDKEMVSFEEPALWLLGRAASGSMRDALSLTDQAIAFGAGAVAEADVRSMLGTVDMSFVYQVLEAVSVGDPAALLALVARMAEHAPDFEASLDELLSLLHRVAVAQVVPSAVDNSRGDAERVTALAAAMTAEDTQLFYQMALNGKRDIPFAVDPRSGFEMTVLRMIAFRPALVFDSGDQALAAAPAAPVAESVAGEVDRPPKKPGEAMAAAPAPQPASNPVQAQQTAAPPEVMSADSQKLNLRSVPVDLSPANGAAPPRRGPDPAVAMDGAIAAAADNTPIAPTTPSETAVVAIPAAPAAASRMSLDAVDTSCWPQLLDQLGLVGIVYNIAANCELREHRDTSFAFVLDSNNMSLFNNSHEGKLRQALENYFATGLSVTVVPGDVCAETPAQRQQRLTLERQQQAVAEIECDPLLQQLIKRFDGELDRASITPMDP